MSEREARRGKAREYGSTRTQTHLVGKDAIVLAAVHLEEPVEALQLVFAHPAAFDALWLLLEAHHLGQRLLLLVLLLRSGGGFLLLLRVARAAFSAFGFRWRLDFAPACESAARECCERAACERRCAGK